MIEACDTAGKAGGGHGGVPACCMGFRIWISLRSRTLRDRLQNGHVSILIESCSVVRRSIVPDPVPDARCGISPGMVQRGYGALSRWCLALTLGPLPKPEVVSMGLGALQAVTRRSQALRYSLAGGRVRAIASTPRALQSKGIVGTLHRCFDFSDFHGSACMPTMHRLREGY